jgi:hypothetical protein
VDPDLDIFSVQELVQSTSVIEMQVPNDDLLHIFQLVSRCLNGSF